MEVTFELELADFVALGQYARAHSGHPAEIRKRLAVLVWSITLLPVVAAWSFLLVLRQSDGVGIGAVVVLVVALLGWHRCIMRYMTRYAELEREYFFPPDGFGRERQNLRVDAQGIVATRPDSTLSYRWSAIQEVVDTKLRIFLILDPIHAINVPDRAFASETDRASFLAYAKEQVAAARKAHPRPAATKSAGLSTAAR